MRTPRQIKADRFDDATPVMVGSVPVLPGLGWLASLVVGNLAAGCIVGVLAIAGVALLVLYVETGFGTDE